MKPVSEFKFPDPEVLEDPYEFYQAAIAQAPVLHLPGTNVFLVTGYDWVCQAGRDTSTFSSRYSDKFQGRAATDPDIRAVLSKGWPFTDTLITNDPPSHARFRGLVGVAFSGPRINAMESIIGAIMDRAIDQLILAEEVEFMAEFAVPVPVGVITGVLGDDAPMASTFKRWSDGFMNLLGGQASKEEEIEAAHQIVEFQHYFKGRIDARRANPAIDDMTACLVNARMDGERPLADAEILSVVQALLVAGNETTTSTLGEGLLLLLRHPEVLGRVRSDASLIPQMVEEILRHTSPASGLWRVVTRDTELNGVAIPAGSMLNLRFAAANRDPKVFANPDVFDIDRPNLRKHVAFGHGPHACIGNLLSRKELNLGFRKLLNRLGSIELSAGKNDFRHVPNILARGLRELHIRVRPAD